MPRKPFVGCLMLAAALVTVSACSSGSSPSSNKTPSSGPKSSHSTSSKPVKLKKETGKGAIKNVYAKTKSGAKISLAAAAPGHEVIEQVMEPNSKLWTPPTSIFKADTRFCHSIKMKATGDLIAATVSCSISAQDTGGTQVSYVLASTDGKTWKRLDLPGASAKPIVSPAGKFVAWPSPTSFLLWDPTGGFKTVKYTQSAAAPAIGVMNDDGTLLIIKATAQKHGSCIISFQSASSKAPTPKTINSTLPVAHPHCVATSAKMQGTQVIANFTQTVTTKVNGKKDVKTTTFAYAFGRTPNGHWIIKA